MIKIPNSVCWNITNQCNDNCLFCYRDKISKDLDFDNQKIIIDKIALSGIRKLTFAGGEPLLIPEIKTLINYAKSKGLMVSLTTNAILLKGEMLDFCLENLDWLTLSLDGSNDSIQNEMTRNTGHFIHVLEVLDYAKHLKQRQCKIKVNTVVSSINQDCILKIADIIVNNAVNRWKLFQFVPLRGNAREHNEKFFISDTAFKCIVQETQKYLEKEETLLSISGRDSIENAYFVIFPNGDIKISLNLEDQIIGNALTDDLQHLWQHELYQKKLHDERTGFIRFY